MILIVTAPLPEGLSQALQSPVTDAQVSLFIKSAYVPDTPVLLSVQKIVKHLPYSLCKVHDDTVVLVVLWIRINKHDGEALHPQTLHLRLGEDTKGDDSVVM